MHADVWVCQQVGVVRRSIACIKPPLCSVEPACLPARLPAYCSLLFVRDSLNPAVCTEGITVAAATAAAAAAAVHACMWHTCMYAPP